MLDQRLSTIPQHHWISKLFGYDFRVEFRLSRSNIVVDALHAGRRGALLAAIADPVAAYYAAFSDPTFRLFDELRREVEADAALCARRDAVASQAHGEAWTVREGLMSTMGVSSFPPHQRCSKTFSSSHTRGGHEGIQKTLLRLRTEFFVEHHRRVVETTCSLARCANGTKLRHSILPVSCNLCRCPHAFGRTSPWISSKPYERYMAKVFCSPWLTGFQVCPLHPFGSPLHGFFGGARLLPGDRASPWHFGVHCQ